MGAAIFKCPGSPAVDWLSCTHVVQMFGGRRDETHLCNTEKSGFLTLKQIKIHRKTQIFVPKWH